MASAWLNGYDFCKVIVERDCSGRGYESVYEIWCMCEMKFQRNVMRTHTRRRYTEVCVDVFYLIFSLDTKDVF